MQNFSFLLMTGIRVLKNNSLLNSETLEILKFSDIIVTNLFCLSQQFEYKKFKIINLAKDLLAKLIGFILYLFD